MKNPARLNLPLKPRTPNYLNSWAVVSNLEPGNVRKSLKGLKKLREEWLCIYYWAWAWLWWCSKPSGTDLFSWHPSHSRLLRAPRPGYNHISPEFSVLNSRQSDKVQLHWILNLFRCSVPWGGFGAHLPSTKRSWASGHHVARNGRPGRHYWFCSWRQHRGLAAKYSINLASTWGRLIQSSTTPHSSS